MLPEARPVEYGEDFCNEGEGILDGELSVTSILE